MTAPLHISGVGQIHIGVRDIHRAVAFYRDMLGLSLLFELPEQGMAFFDCGGVRLYMSTDQSAEFPSNPLIYYRVADIDAACRFIAEKGVELYREPHVVHRAGDHELWMAGFHDPEGNFIHLMSEVSLNT